jgi:proteasome accessory factor A
LLTPFLVTRPVFAGAGRVGLGQRGERPGFQLTQRADFLEAEVGLETTLRRPIINTRDEPHADSERFRRLHVIVGDANMLQVATYLKVGTTSLATRSCCAPPGCSPRSRACRRWRSTRTTPMARAPATAPTRTT